MRPPFTNLLRSWWILLSIALLPSWGLNAAGNPPEPARHPVSEELNWYDLGAPISLMEAVRVTLSRSPTILIQQSQTEVSRGELMTDKGAFDTHFAGTATHGALRQPVLTAPTPTPSAASTAPVIFPVSNLATGLPVGDFGIIIPQAAAAPAATPSVYTQNESSFDVGLHKLLYNGTEVSADAIYDRTNEVNLGPIFNTSELRLTVNVPVLRFFTPSDQASLVHEGRINYEASLLTYRHAISEAVLQTAQAYWTLRAAQEQLDCLRQSEQEALSLQRLISLLIKGQERAKADIHEIDARVADTKAQRLAGEQTLYQARQQLGLAMGLDEDDLRNAPFAGQPFPSSAGLEGARTIQDQLIMESIISRADYQASLKDEQSAHVLMDAARRDILPPVNFQVMASEFGGYIGSRFNDAIEHTFLGRQTGVSVVGQLTFDWPLENQAARGNYVQTRAEYRQSGIQTDDLRRTIVSGILTNIDSLAVGSLQLEQARESAAAYSAAVETERLKYVAGESTLLDVITLEDDYTNSVLTAVQVDQQIAQDYAQLRFQSGTMFLGAGSKMTLQSNSLVSLPHVPAGAPIARIPNFRVRLQLP